MKKNLFIIAFLAITIFNACKNTKYNNESINPEPIKVSVLKKYPRGNFKDYFASSKVISLETTKSSLFRDIDRLSIYNDKIFILDKKSNAVLIFSKTGKFINKINSTGKGPREYISLKDFSIDEKKKYVILYSDRPYKLLFYDLEGTFIKEQKLKDYYFNIAFLNNKLLTLTKNKKNGKMLIDYDLGKEVTKEFLEMNDKDKFFLTLGQRTPNFIKSKDINISLSYSEMLYQYNGAEVLPSYLIDFGNYKTPDEIMNNLDKYYTGIFKTVKENNYGFGVSNFRENRDYITFNFWNNMITIYSKKSKEAKSFRSFMNPEDKIPFFRYFAHDGDDNKIISLFTAQQFKSQINIYKKSSEIWPQLPKYIKEIDAKISNNDNPLLVVYTFKE